MINDKPVKITIKKWQEAYSKKQLIDLQTDTLQRYTDLYKDFENLKNALNTLLFHSQLQQTVRELEAKIDGINNRIDEIKF